MFLYEKYRYKKTIRIKINASDSGNAGEHIMIIEMISNNKLCMYH